MFKAPSRSDLAIGPGALRGTEKFLTRSIGLISICLSGVVDTRSEGNSSTGAATSRETDYRKLAFGITHVPNSHKPEAGLGAVNARRLIRLASHFWKMPCEL